jgi:Concanavalin A-like lectin/glucanases superfamily
VKKIAVLLMVLAMVFIIGGASHAGLNDGLIAYWPFNGNANDESGQGNDGTVHGATLTQDRFGNPNSAYNFDGIDDYIDIGNNVKPTFPITVSTWIKLYELNASIRNTGIFRNDRWNDAANRNGLALYYLDTKSAGSVTFEGFSANWNRISKHSNDPVVSTGDWHHYAVVFHAHNNMQQFWDGTEIDGTYYGTGSSMTYSSSNGAIGHYIHNTGSIYFKGDIDDIRVYSRALSSSEILDLFSEKCGFIDVPPGYWAEAAIYKIYNAGITTGCSTNPLMYCPEGTVTRTQMAVFLGRAIHGSSFTPPTATGIFSDVPVSYWAADWIEQFYNDGITSGCGTSPLRYCPGNNVTRAQMAIFLLRSKHGSSYTPPAASGIFSDVPITYWAADWIEQLYNEGITTGCATGPLRYCPENSVTRAQMAVFMMRTFGL